MRRSLCGHRYIICTGWAKCMKFESLGAQRARAVTHSVNMHTQALLTWLVLNTCSSSFLNIKHFKSPSIKPRFIQIGLTLLHSVFCGQARLLQLVSMFNFSIPTRHSRNTGTFHMPPGRVNANYSARRPEAAARKS